MCYDSQTFEVLHKLTAEGEREYQKLLEREGDRILWEGKHPMKAVWLKAMRMFGWEGEIEYQES